MKTILVIDGKGGGMGGAIVAKLKSALPSSRIIALGTNALATSAMLKSGADDGATGENAIIYNCRSADIICGPIGIVLPNSMLGEVTATIASAITQSDATKILIPASKCSVTIAGIRSMTMAQYIDEAISLISEKM